MMKLRHLVAFVAVPVLIATACSSDDDGDAGTSTPAAAATTAPGSGGSSDTASRRHGDGGTGKKVTIVASVPPTDHGWLGQIAAKAQEAADGFDDVDFRLLEAADADSQASQIETVINEKPDALVVLPYDGDQLTPVAEKAMEAGIPVINVDRLFATPGRRPGDDPRRQLPDRRQGGDVHRRQAELQGQRRRDPGHRRHLGDHRPQQGLRRHDQGAVRRPGSRSSPSSPPTSSPTRACR